MSSGEVHPGPGPIRPYEDPEEQEQEREIEQTIGRCKRSGKETELHEGLCTECRWEIKVGLQHLLQQEKKHHFWSHDKTESQPTVEQSENESGTSTD